MISNVNSLAIVTSSICEPRAIVTSPWPIVLTLHLWTLSSSQWRCQPGRFSMAAHRHDRRGIYRCVLLRFRGRIEIDHSYGLSCRGLCCHSRHSTRGAGRRDGRLHSCCAGSGSTNHSSADRIVVNSYNHQWFKSWIATWSAPSHYLNKLRWNFNRNPNIAFTIMRLKHGLRNGCQFVSVSMR